MKTHRSNNILPKQSADKASTHALTNQAFDSSMQPQLIIDSGNDYRIVLANRAARKLLGYGLKELLAKSRADIFAEDARAFKKMLKQRKSSGESGAHVMLRHKKGHLIPCDITSTIFTDSEGIEKAIYTITNRSEEILKQKVSDAESKKLIATDKQQAISKQKLKDIKNNKIVAKNIALAKTKQKAIDIKKEKIVADDIELALIKSEERLQKYNEWIKYIAKTSYDVMWDWDISTGNMYVGDSLQEVFGYVVNDNTIRFSEFYKSLVPDEQIPFKKSLYKAINSDEKIWKNSFSVRRYDKTVANVSARASIVRDDNGKALHMIGNIQDTTRMEELENKLKLMSVNESGPDSIEAISKLTFDGIWDWNIETNEFFLGDGFNNIFGIDECDKTKKLAWETFLHPEDKEGVEIGMKIALESDEATWEQSYRFIKENGETAYVYCRANIIRDMAGKACRMIRAVHDITRQSEVQYDLSSKNKLIESYKKSLSFLFNSSSEMLYDIDLITNEVTVSPAYEKEFGQKFNSSMIPDLDWKAHIHPGDKKRVLNNFERIIFSNENEWKQEYRLLKADKSSIKIITHGIIQRDEKGIAYRIHGFIHGAGKKVILEEVRAQEIKLKEQQLMEAVADAREAERLDIGRELHDNVNQLLTASRLYLSMAKMGGNNTELYFSRSSEYTMTAIEEIRKLTRGLTGNNNISDLGLAGAIAILASDTMETSALKIIAEIKNFNEKDLSTDQKLNVYRIVQEQLGNILKHAGAKSVKLKLHSNKKNISLLIADDGRGFDTSKKQMGIGIANIKSRAKELHGSVDITSAPGNGCVIKCIFPVPEKKLKTG